MTCSMLYEFRYRMAVWIVVDLLHMQPSLEYSASKRVHEHAIVRTIMTDTYTHTPMCVCIYIYIYIYINHNVRVYIHIFVHIWGGRAGLFCKSSILINYPWLWPWLMHTDTDDPQQTRPYVFIHMCVILILCGLLSHNYFISGLRDSGSEQHRLRFERHDRLSDSE